MSVATSQPRVSVVVPTYNEKENVREFNRRLRPVVGSLGGKVDVVFVDDNSPDGTASEIRRLMQESPDIHLIERPGKQGLGTAYLDGFKYVVDNFDPEIVIQIDADLQHPPEMVETL